MTPVGGGRRIVTSGRHIAGVRRTGGPVDDDKTPADGEGGGPCRIRTVVLVGADPTVPGGRSMRWQALRRGLDDIEGCELWELSCDRTAVCAAVCRHDPTGRDPGGAAGVRSMRRLVGEGRTAWYYERSFCERQLERLIEDLTRAGVHTVVCSGLDSARYVPALAAVGSFRVVFDMHNVETLLHAEIRDAVRDSWQYEMFYTDEHVENVGSAEYTAVHTADHVWTCTEHDRRLVVARFGETLAGKTWVVPNVVDLPRTTHEPSSEVERICFTGGMDYYPNHDAAATLVSRIAPLLAQIAGSPPVVIAGAKASTWAAGEFGPDRLPANVRVVSDPRGVGDIIDGAVMVVPLKIGGGSRFKVLEAFAWAAPVVSSAKGVEGLDLVAGEHYLAAHEPAEFAHAVKRLISDPALRRELTGNGRSLLRRRYSMQALTHALSAALAGHR